jgi:periplasmic protein TonB
MKHYATTRLDDVVFDGRNKSYGAYQLRYLYHYHNGIGGLCTILLFLLALLIVNKVNKKEWVETIPYEWKKETTVVEILPIDREPEPVPQTAAAPIQQQVETIRNVELEPVPDQIAPETTPLTQQQLLQATAHIGHENRSGISGIAPVVDPSSGGTSGGSGNTGAAASNAGTGAGVTTDYVIAAQYMAEFPGGVQAMKAFLGKNINYPQTAMEQEIEGVVVVQFIIEKDGRISNLEVLRDPGGGLGKEALRVFKKMPAWKPARQGDTPVRLRMTAPVAFKLK